MKIKGLFSLFLLTCLTHILRTRISALKSEQKVIENTPIKQTARAERIIGAKSIVSLTPESLSWIIVESSLPFLTFRASKAFCSWLFIVLTARHFMSAISFFSYPCAYILAVISHSRLNSISIRSIIVELYVSQLDNCCIALVFPCRHPEHRGKACNFHTTLTSISVLP